MALIQELCQFVGCLWIRPALDNAAVQKRLNKRPFNFQFLAQRRPPGKEQIKTKATPAPGLFAHNFVEDMDAPCQSEHILCVKGHFQVFTIISLQ